MLAFIQHQRVLHAERIEDCFLQELGVALAASPLNDLPQHFVPGIAVFKSGTGSKFQLGLTAERLQYFGRRKFMRGVRAFRGTKEIVVDLPDHQFFVVWQPGNVMQQITNADCPRVRGNSGQYLSRASSNLSLPCSERIMIAMAVNCLVMDASSNCVSGVRARCVSRSASPKDVRQTIRPSWMRIATIPGAWFSR